VTMIRYEQSRILRGVRDWGGFGWSGMAVYANVTIAVGIDNNQIAKGFEAMLYKGEKV
jgi:hypothetical protein